MQVTQEERDKLVGLYKRASETPVIALSVKDGIEGKDWATLAWNDVRNYYDELGKKYNFDPQKQCINPKTLEIVNIPNA